MRACGEVYVHLTSSNGAEDSFHLVLRRLIVSSQLLMMCDKLELSFMRLLGYHLEHESAGIPLEAKLLGRFSK